MNTLQLWYELVFESDDVRYFREEPEGKGKKGLKSKEKSASSGKSKDKEAAKGGDKDKGKCVLL